MQNYILKYLQRAISALAIVLLIAACAHIFVALISALITEKIEYINPVEFLGLGLIFPKYLHSATATVLAWAFLIGVFVIIYIFHTSLYLVVSVSKNDQRKPFIGLGDLKILKYMQLSKAELIKRRKD